MDKKYLYVIMWDGDITKTEISKESEKCFWDMNGYRMLKNSDGCNAFNTLEEATIFLIAKKRATISRYKNEILSHNKRIKELGKELEELRQTLEVE